MIEEPKKEKDMKKIITTLALIIACQGTFAQNIQNLFDEFGKEYQAESISISPFLMWIGKCFMSNDTPTIAKRIKSMRILDLEDCTQQVKERFSEQVSQLQLEGYEPMIQVKEDGEKVQIFALPHKNGIKELLLVCTGEGDCAFIQMKGKIRQEDIAELVNEQTVRKNGRK